MMETFQRQRVEPMFNVPPAVLATTAILALVHLVRQLMGPDADVDSLLYFAFIPARYADMTVLNILPGGPAAAVWTFVTYALLHADWTHLIINAVWLLAFGAPVAWRFGTARFMAFFAATAAAGAGAHLMMHFGDPQPLVGASAALSGLMAAAARFAFDLGGPLGPFRARGIAAYRMPALPLWETVRNPRVFAFLAVWMGLNLLFGASAIGTGLAGSTIAWEAHIGGFVAGLVGFAAFDPIGGRD